MSLVDRLRPRWQHSNPEVRKTAVAEIKDVALLKALAEMDSDAGVRETAFLRVTDEDLLRQFALGTGEFNVRAAERLVDPRHIVAVARQAPVPEVRAAAVARVDDPLVLLQIAAFDVDPSVRRGAKRRHAAPDCMREHLQTALSHLEIAERAAGRVAEYCGSLNDLCGALGADGRFEIHGFVTDSEPGEAADQLPHAAETMAPFSMNPTPPRRQFVELLGGRSPRNGALNEQTQPVFYRIKIWRRDQNAYEWTLEERQISMTKDVVTWSKSSHGEEDRSPPAGGSAAPMRR